MLDAKKIEPKEQSANKADVITQLVAASEQPDDEGMKASSRKGALSQQEMAGNLFIFTAAGFDTTAASKSFLQV